jgi:molybdopterin-containing oxidoreductase family iron-sulfur binding subunit
MVFGNRSDPESRVSKMLKDERAYKVLEELNTSPSVVYLERAHG